MPPMIAGLRRLLPAASLLLLTTGAAAEPAEPAGTPSADFSLSIDNGTNQVVMGGRTLYTIEVANNGPDAGQANITVGFDSYLACGWTCSGSGGATCTAPSGISYIEQNTTMPANGRLTYLADCSVSPDTVPGQAGAYGLVSPQSPIIDPQPGNNSAEDIDTPIRLADLSISKSNGVDQIAAGAPTTYTIVVRNDGPSVVADAVVSDSIDGTPLVCVFHCSSTVAGWCTSPQYGSLLARGRLLPGQIVTYTADCHTGPATRGTISNTASVGGGHVDSDPSDNSATDTDLVGVQSDLAVTLTTPAQVAAGGLLGFTLNIANHGPSDPGAIPLQLTLPAQCRGLSWTCTSQGGVCPGATGSGPLPAMLQISSDYALQFGLLCTVDPALAPGSALQIQASVATPDGSSDPAAGNNSASGSVGVVAATGIPGLQTTGMLLLGLGLLLCAARARRCAG